MIDFINAWERKEETIELCKEAKACVDEFKKLYKAYEEDNQIDFENVLLANFSIARTTNVQCFEMLAYPNNRFFKSE